MRQLLSFFSVFCGIILFIWLLPALLWFLLILIVGILAYVYYQKHKYNKYINEFMKDTDFQEDSFTNENSHTNSSVNEDIIDVEFSESEDDNDTIR